jgi:hypothetical protein
VNVAPSKIRSAPVSESRPFTTRTKTAFGGILTRTERWGLSSKGWLLALLAAGALSLLLVLNIYPFLSVTERISADTLVVEGWVHPYAIQAAANEFVSGGYRQLLTTGGPVVGTGSYTNDFNTSANVGAVELRAAGVNSEAIQAVPSRVANRDRTYASASALDSWIKSHQPAVQSLNVLTEAPHARRTRMLFQKALGKNVRVGIIAVPSPDYEPKDWWRYSDGVRDVIGESIAYVYAKFSFSPERSR